jgi:hypothetical protein
MTIADRYARVHAKLSTGFEVLFEAVWAQN